MRISLIIIAFSLLVSCQNNYTNFDELDTNVHFKLMSFDEETSSLSNSDYIEIQYEFCEEIDCPDIDLIKVSYTSLKEGGRPFANFSLNDELILIFDSLPSLFWLDLFGLENEVLYWPIIAKLKISKALNEESKLVKENDEALWMYREKKEIENLLKDSSLSYKEKGQCYIGIMNEGGGDTVLEGREIILSYKAHYANGKIFDDTDKWKDSIDFIYGQPFQLIAGLEAGIHGLREGAEAKIIIPSHLAFGKHGSSSGIVPPFEPLLYNVKIISVKHPFL